MLHPECARCVCVFSQYNIFVTPYNRINTRLHPVTCSASSKVTQPITFKSMIPVSLLQLLPVAPPTFSKSHDLLPHPLSPSHVTCCHTHLFGVPQRVVIGQMHELVDQVRLVEVTG